jgi:hypothetical protein
MAHKKAPEVKNDAPGMLGPRSRNEDGVLRQKRGDTLVGTLEQQYHVDFGVRSDMKLSTLRDQLGETSIEKLIEKNNS